MTPDEQLTITRKFFDAMRDHSASTRRAYAIEISRYWLKSFFNRAGLNVNVTLDGPTYAVEVTHVECGVPIYFSTYSHQADAMDRFHCALRAAEALDATPCA